MPLHEAWFSNVNKRNTKRKSCVSHTFEQKCYIWNIFIADILKILKLMVTFLFHCLLVTAWNTCIFKTLMDSTVFWFFLLYISGNISFGIWLPNKYTHYKHALWDKSRFLLLNKICMKKWFCNVVFFSYMIRQMVSNVHMYLNSETQWIYWRTATKSQTITNLFLQWWYRPTRAYAYNWNVNWTIVYRVENSLALCIKSNTKVTWKERSLWHSSTC